MIIATIKLYGDKELVAGVKKLAKESIEGLQRAVKATCMNIEKGAKQKVAVDTGRLKTSITHRVETTGGKSVQGEVGTDVPYAMYQEFGTRPHLAPVGDTWKKRHGFGGSGDWLFVTGKANPFLMPAFYENKGFFVKQITDELAKLRLT